MNIVTKEIQLPDGRTIKLETGKLAKQADGAVMLTCGKTMLLATVCAAKDAVPGTDFMPLQVEYREKYASIGRFPGGFTKREGRPSDYEILVCRLVDRALRPLFPDNYHAEVFVNIILFSADGEDMPDALAGLAASAALAVSDIPFQGPISEVRVARIDGEYVINPTFKQLEEADMDIIVAATYDNIMMVEGEMKEHYWLENKQAYECKRCQARQTLRSGTVMQHSNLPYRYWFVAMHLLTATKGSFSAAELQRQLGHKRYQPIWEMVNKLRDVMGKRDDEYTLEGAIELDDAFFSTEISVEEKEKPLKRGR